MHGCAESAVHGGSGLQCAIGSGQRPEKRAGSSFCSGREKNRIEKERCV